MCRKQKKTFLKKINKSSTQPGITLSFLFLKPKLEKNNVLQSLCFLYFLTFAEGLTVKNEQIKKQQAFACRKRKTQDFFFLLFLWVVPTVQNYFCIFFCQGHSHFFVNF